MNRSFSSTSLSSNGSSSSRRLFGGEYEEDEQLMDSVGRDTIRARPGSSSGGRTRQLSTLQGLGIHSLQDSESASQEKEASEFLLSLQKSNATLQKKLKAAQVGLESVESRNEERVLELGLKLDESKNELICKRREEKEMRNKERDHLSLIQSVRSITVSHSRDLASH